MAERQPISGRLVESIQKRYTSQRIATGTATEHSSSEFFLKHLKEKGLTGGLPTAISEYHHAILERGTFDKFFHGWLETGFILVVGGAHFILTASGINGINIDNWKVGIDKKNK